MSNFKFSCPHCGQHIEATDEYAGQQIPCPVCQKSLVVPQPPGAPPRQTGLAKTAVAGSSAIGTTSAAASVRQQALLERKKPKIKPAVLIALASLVVVAIAAYFLVPWALQKHVDAEAADTQATIQSNQPPPPPEYSAADILKKTADAYKSLKDFQAEDTTVSIIDKARASDSDAPPKPPTTNTTETTIKLAHPNSYRLDWSRQLAHLPQKGLAWSTGNGDFFSVGNRATRSPTREANLGIAAGASGSLTTFITQLFFADNNSLVASIADAIKQDDDHLNGQTCYVISGTLNSQRIMLWIVKKNFLIAQTSLILGNPVNIPTLDEDKITEATKAANNGSATSEQVAQTKAAIKQASTIAPKLRGSITDTYENIQTNQSLSADAFQQGVPNIAATSAPAPPSQNMGEDRPRRRGASPSSPTQMARPALDAARRHSQQGE